MQIAFGGFFQLCIGNAFEQLMNGVKTPATYQQVHFLDVCCGKANAENEYEKVWRKYLLRLKWEANPKNQSAMSPSQIFNDNSFGGSRESYKEMKRELFKDMVKRRREN